MTWMGKKGDDFISSIFKNIGNTKYSNYLERKRDDTKTYLDKANINNDYKYAENSYNPVPHLNNVLNNNNNNNNKNKDTGINITSYADFIKGNPEYGNYTQYFQKYHQGYEAAFDPAEKGISLIFITKPNLNLTTINKSELPDIIKTIKKSSDNKMFNFNFTFGSSSSVEQDDKAKLIYNSVYNGFFQWINCYYQDITKSLNYSLQSSNGIPNFIPCISSFFKSINLDDIATYEMTYGDTYKGYQERIPNTYAQSAAGGSVNISYIDDSNLTLTKLHKLWFEYIELVRFGFLSPSKATLRRKELDYTSSIYFLGLEPDGRTINFWGRYLGVAPQGMPYSAFGSGVGERGLVELNCSYMYTMKQFMEPEILYDFNMIFQYNDGDVNIKNYVDGNTLLDEQDIVAGRDDNDQLDRLDNDMVLGSKIFFNKNGYYDLIPSKEQSKINQFNFDEKLGEENPNYNRCAVYRDGNKFKLHYYIK